MFSDRMLGDPVVCPNNHNHNETRESSQKEVSKKDVEQKQQKKLASITDFFHPQAKGNRKQNATIVGFFKTRTEENLKEQQMKDNINSEEDKGHKPSKEGTVDLYDGSNNQEHDTCNHSQSMEPSQSQSDNQSHVNVESSGTNTTGKDISENSAANVKQKDKNTDGLACPMHESQNKSSSEKVICETIYNSEPNSDILSYGEVEKKHKPPKWSLSWKPSTKSCKSVNKRPPKALSSSDSDFESENIKSLKKTRKAGTKKKRKQEIDKLCIGDPINRIDGDVLRQSVERSLKGDAEITQEQVCPQKDAVTGISEGEPEIVRDTGKLQENSVKDTIFQVLPEDRDVISIKTLQQEACQSSGPSVFDVLMKKKETKEYDTRESDQLLLANDADSEKQSQSVDLQAGVGKSSKRKSREFKLSIRMVPKKTKKGKGKNEVECDEDNLDTVTKLEDDILGTFGCSIDQQGEKRQGAKLTNKKAAERKVNKEKRKERTLKVSDDSQDETTGDLNKNLTEELCTKKGKDVMTKKGKTVNATKPRGRPRKVEKTSDSDDFQTCTKASKQEDKSDKEPVCSVDKNKAIVVQKKSKRHTDQTRDKTVTEKKRGGNKKTMESSDDPVNEEDDKNGEQSSEIEFIDESSLETNSAPISKSLRSKEKKKSSQQMITVEESAAQIIAKPTEPVKLAPIFTRPKPEPKPKTTTKEDKGVHQQVSNSECTEMGSLQPDNPVVINIDAANKAFSALFTGARSSKTVAAGSAVVSQTPAPWPVFSHVMQREEFGTGSGSSLNNSKSKVFDLVEARDGEEPGLLSRLQFDGKSVLGLLPTGEEDGLNASEKETIEREELPEEVIKKLVSELGTIHYPGIKVKRLFKRYRAKHQNLAPAALEGSKKNLQTADDKSVSSTAQAECGRKTKRKLSCNHSESQTKIPRIEPKAETAKDLENGIDDLHERRHKPATRGCGAGGVKPVRTEEESGHQRTRRSKRLSGRLQKETNTTEELTPSRTDLESGGSERQKKRRKTSKNDNDALDKTLPHCTVTTNKSTDTLKQTKDACASMNQPVDDNSNIKSDNSKKQDDHSQVPWTDRYQPSCAADVMANASSVAKMKVWLGEWKVKREKTLRKELEHQKKLLAKGKGKTGSKAGTQTVEWWDQDSDSDFDIDDASDDSDCDDDQGLCNTMLVTGARGVGKTAMIYACARELGYKVFEMNCSSKRSGKHILTKLEEATQSHQVIGSKSAASMFQGGMKSPTEQATNKIPSSSPLAAFLKPVVKPQEEKKKRKSKNKSGKDSKNVKEKTHEPAVPSKSFPTENLTESNTGLSIKAASLILFEEVDVIFEEDKGFWAAVGSFMQNAKCPIIMTSNEFHLGCDRRYEHISIKPPSVPLLAAHLQLICLLNNLLISPYELKAFVASTNCDIRKCLLSLQFWAESGGGLRLPYEISGEEANRPANVREVEVSEESNSSGRNEIQILTGDFSESQAVDGGSCHNKEDLITSKADAVCNPIDEESMFLSVDEFKQITSKGETENSVNVPSCRLTSPLVTEVTSDSVASEVSDSQSVDLKKGVAMDTQLFPSVHHLLVESTTGILNCHPCATKGAIAFLKVDACRKKEDGSESQDMSFTAKCSMTSYCQSLDVNLVSCNLTKLMPSLFTDSLDPNGTASKQPVSVFHSNQSAVPERSITLQNTFFQDKSLFDDGIEPRNDIDPNPSQSQKSHGGDDGGITNGRCRTTESSELNMTGPGDAGSSSLETSFGGERNTSFQNQCGIKSQLETDDCSNSSPTRVDGQLVDTECNEVPEIDKYMQFASLEVFSHLAEDISFMDANIPKLPPYKSQYQSAEFGWWHAKLRPDLVDDTCKHQDKSDWITRETRAALRGAVEVASVESQHVKFQSLREWLSSHYRQSKETEVDGNPSCEVETEFVNKMSRFLPPRDPGGVLQIASHDDYQRYESSREKLYSNVSSALPTSLHCIHKVVATEYLPSLRAICHAERLRETAKTKRRFLHYLDSNSFTISHSNQDSLADAFLLN